MSDVKPIPDTYARVTPHLTVEDASGAMAFYGTVLGGSERMRMAMPDGTVVHAEIVIGGSVVMVGQADLPIATEPSPTALGGSPVSLFVYVEDVDDVFKRAVAEGAKPIMEPEEHFYGDRIAIFDDPSGHRWTIGTHIEDVPPEELDRRGAELMSSWQGKPTDG